MLLQAPPALVQPAPAPAFPAGFAVPPGLEVKPQSLDFTDFDQETFELRSPATATVSRIPVEGRTWRFILRSDGPRVGAITLLERLKPGLEGAGWVWAWAERGVARKVNEGGDTWFRATAGASGELKCVLVEKGPPPHLDLRAPGPAPEQPGPQEDFPYITPWPGSTLTASATSQAPVGLFLPDGKQALGMVNWIEKEYQLAKPVSGAAFLAAYKEALKRAGWEIEGSHRGAMLELQAYYDRHGRDIRLVLRLGNGAMGISVADVGAQLPKGAK